MLPSRWPCGPRLPIISKTPSARAPLAVAFWSPVLRQKCDVVSRNESIEVFRGCEPGDIIGMFTDQFGCVGARIIHDAAGDLFTIRTDDGHDVAVCKLIFYTGDACIEEACILLCDRIERTLVNVDPSGDRRSKRNPPALLPE